MKNKFPLITGACIVALALCAPHTASAQFKKSSPSPTATATATASPTAKAPRAIPYRGTISAVDGGAKTFSIAGKETTRVFKVTEKTVITKDGTPASMDDVTENQKVRGSYWKHEDGSLEAKTVKLGAKTDAEKAKSKKKKESETSASPSPAASPSPKP